MLVYVKHFIRIVDYVLMKHNRDINTIKMRGRNEKNIVKSFAAFLLVLCMMLTNLGGWNLVLAEEVSEDTKLEEILDEVKPPEADEDEPKKSLKTMLKRSRRRRE